MATKKALTVGVGLKKVVASDLASEIIHMADSKHNSFIESKMFQDKLKEIFKETDYDGNGTVSHEEIYTMVLLLYLYVAQSTTINAKTIPSRARVEEIYDIMDVDDSGSLDFHEFRAMAIFLVEDMAARVMTQIVVKSVLGPILGFVLVEVVNTYLVFMGIDTHKKMAAYLPKWLYNEAMAVTVATALATMFLLPYVVSLIDRVMQIRSNKKSRNILKEKAKLKFIEESKKSENEARAERMRAYSHIQKQKSN